MVAVPVVQQAVRTDRCWEGHTALAAGADTAAAEEHMAAVADTGVAEGGMAAEVGTVAVVVGTAVEAGTVVVEAGMAAEEGKVVAGSMGPEATVHRGQVV